MKTEDIVKLMRTYGVENTIAGRTEEKHKREDVGVDVDQYYREKAKKQKDTVTGHDIETDLVGSTKELARQQQKNNPKAKASTAENALRQYVESDYYKKKQEEQDQKAMRDQFIQNTANSLAGNPVVQQSTPKMDETEVRLRAEAQKARAEADAAEEAEMVRRDTADIEALSEEDRKRLEQYAVNRIRDQNLPLEMVGKVPTAEQEAAEFIGKYGKQRADELAETFMRQENAALARQAEAAGREYANEKPVLASAATVPVNLMASIAGTVGQLQGAARATGRYSSLDSNETGTALDKFSGAVREQTAQNIEGEDPNLLRKAGSVLYQGGMNFLDSTARMLVSGGSAGVSSAISGMGAFSQGLQKYSAMGASPEQAALAATASAGLEYITEKLPTEKVLKIFHKGGSTSAVKEVLKQAFLVEPAGEEVNLFAGIAAEAMILGEKSGKAQRIGDLIAGGMTKEEAEKQFWKETFSEAINTYAVSAVAGGLGAGSAAYAGNQMQTRKDQQTTSQIQEDSQAAPVLSGAEQVNQAAEAVGESLAENAPTQVPQPEVQPASPEMEQLDAAVAATIGAQPVQPTDNSTGNKSIKLYRGYNQSDDPTRKNLTKQQSVYNILGREDPNEIKNLLPLAYYTENEEDARSYADMDVRQMDEYRKNGIYEYRDRVMRGKDVEGLSEEEYADRAAKRSFMTMHGREPNAGGRVERYDYTPGKVLDLTELGEMTNVDAAYKVLADKFGIEPSELDNILTMGNNFENDFPAFALLRNTPRDNIGTKIVDLAKKAGYDSIRYSEDGNSHYAIITDRQDWDKNLIKDKGLDYAPDVDTSEAVQMGASNTQQQSTEDVQGIKGTGAAEGNFSGKPAYNATLSEDNAQTEDSEAMTTEGGQTQIKGTGAAEGNFSGKPAYNATLSEDNAQADRRNDVRPMELPARDINGNNISAVTGNVYGAGVTPDEFASLMEEPTARGDFSYVPISNNQATQQAMDNITRLGWQDAYAQWSQAVHQGRAGAEMSARGALFLNHAAQAGDRQQWLNILSDFQRLGTNTAQGLQAFRILRNLAPSDRLYLMRRSVAQMVDDMHLNVPIQIDQQLADQYQNAQTNEEADAILDQIITDVAGQIPSTVGDRWTALRYVNMLGNMRTQARNISGNIGARATYMAKDQIGAFLEKIVHRFNPNIQRTKSAWVSRELKALGRADFDDVRDIVLENGRFDDARRFDSTRFAREVNERRRIFRSRFMESYRRLTNWAMNNDHFGDAGFARAAYARAFGGYLKANGFTGNTLDGIDQTLLDNARLYAIQQAQESTFRDHNAVSDWVGRIGRRPDTPRAVRALSEGVMPFRSTPANVLVRAEEFSPLGIINTAVTAAQAANPNSDVTGTDVIESMAKTLTGTGLLIVGAYLSKMGMLSGGPDPDDEQEAFGKMNGQQNYALQLPGGKSITIDFLSPMAVPMFLGAELEKIISDGGYDLADFEKVFTSLADPLIQMSMLQGLNDTLDDIKYSENNLGQFFLNAAMSYLTQGLTNTLMGQLERSSEENRMTTYVDKDSAVPQWIQQQAGKMSQKIPGWDYQQTEYFDAWGQPQKNEGGLAYDLMSPGYISTERSDQVTKELNRLKAAGVEENVFPDMASATVTWTDKKGTVHENDNLTAEQHQTLAKIQGQTSRELLEDMFASKDYAALTDAQKAKAIDSAYLYARKTGEIAAIDGHTGYDETWMMDVKKKGANEILRRVLNSELNGSMTDLDEAWDKGYDEENFDRVLQTAYDSFSKATPAMKKQVYNEAEGTTKKYLEARSKGISHIDFVAVAENIAKVKGTGSINKDTGKPTVRDVDRWKAIANSGELSYKETDTVMKLYMPDYDPNAKSKDTTELKYDYARQELGMSPAEYTAAYDIYGYEKSAGGKGTAERTKQRLANELDMTWAEASAVYSLFYGNMKDELIELYG